MEVSMALSINDTAPDFEAETTEGNHAPNGIIPQAAQVRPHRTSAEPSHC
jgi:hypothetical protein